MLTGAVAVQALLSASNFAVGLLLVRRTSQAEYGYYVLITTAILLVSVLQVAFIQPPMVIRLARSTQQEQADFIGGLLSDQRQLVRYAWILVAAIAVVLWLSSRTTPHLLTILVTGAAAVLTSLDRNFFRMVLFAHRLPEEVLRSDFIYCILLIGGTFLATLTRVPAAATAVALALSSVIGGLLLARTLRRREPWTRHAPTGMLKEIVSDGAWSAFGGGVHWLFSQGYTYLVAGTIGVGTLAALSATKLFTTPVGLLSIGIGTLMLPTTSRWNNTQKPVAVLGRLALFSFGLDAIALIYFLIIWFLRGWIFDHVLKRHYQQGDSLLLVWFAAAIVTVFRDQLLYFLMARAKFKSTSALTCASAILSLGTSFVLMRHMGGIGAALGLLLGEAFNTVGIIALSLWEAKRHPALVAASQ